MLFTEAMINDDISECDAAIRDGTVIGNYSIHNRLISRYSKIDGFMENLKSISNDEYGFCTKANLELIRQKLTLFKAMGNKKNYAAGKVVSNLVTVPLDILYIHAMQQIIEMPNLSIEKIDEILTTLDALRRIVESNKSINKKWENAKEIVKWIAENDVNIGLTFIPILLKLK